MKRTLLLIFVITLATVTASPAAYTTIQMRRDTPANWTAYNPILASGEPGCEMTGSPARCTSQKVGDGVTRWVDLPYTSKRETYSIGKDFPTLNAAAAYLGSTRATVYVPADTALTGDLTTLSTLEIVPTNGAVISHGGYVFNYGGSTERWPLARVLDGTGVVLLNQGYNPVWFPPSYSSGWVASSGIAYGLSKSVALPRIENKTNGNGFSQGVYRNYSSAGSSPDTGNGHFMAFDANFNADAQTTSAVGLNLTGKVRKGNNSSGSFAWHQLQNYVESDAVAPAEIATEYAFIQTTNGASPEGAFITSVATGPNQHNLQYGAQITTVDETGAYGSGTKTLSIRHLSSGGLHPAANGGIMFGSGGFVNGYRVTNKGERLEPENIASGEHGGVITNAVIVDGTDAQWIDYFALTGAISVGDVVTGASSGKTGTIVGVYAATATEGKLYARDFSGAFTPGEFLTVGGVNKAKANSISTPQSSGSITNALTVQNVASRAVTVLDAAGTELFGITGKGQTRRKITNVAANATSIDASQGDAFKLASDTDGTLILDVINGAEGQEITIYGGGGASPMVIDGVGGGATKINLIGAVDWVGTAGRVLKLGYDGQWREISRN